jgi:Na+/proline symporter
MKILKRFVIGLGVLAFFAGSLVLIADPSSGLSTGLRWGMAAALVFIALMLGIVFVAGRARRALEREAATEATRREP